MIAECPAFHSPVKLRTWSATIVEEVLAAALRLGCCQELVHRAEVLSNQAAATITRLPMPCGTG